MCASLDGWVKTAATENRHNLCSDGTRPFLMDDGQAMYARSIEQGADVGRLHARLRSAVDRRITVGLFIILLRACVRAHMHAVSGFSFERRGIGSFLNFFLPFRDIV